MHTTIMPGFFSGPRHLNSGSHVCMAASVLTGWAISLAPSWILYAKESRYCLHSIIVMFWVANNKNYSLSDLSCKGNLLIYRLNRLRKHKLLFLYLTSLISSPWPSSQFVHLLSPMCYQSYHSHGIIVMKEGWMNFVPQCFQSNLRMDPDWNDLGLLSSPETGHCG